MEVCILRGIPGSGKSTWINKLPSKVIHCSADHYHTDPQTGYYNYNKENAHLAHRECLHKFANALVAKEPFIVVDNTNTTMSELLPYYKLAEAYNNRVRIILFHCSFETAINRNVHNVPIDTIWRMYRNTINENIPYPQEHILT